MPRIISDFNETLVRERTLSAWCIDHMRVGSLRTRLKCSLRCMWWGLVARLADFAGLEAMAAELGFRVFSGRSVTELEHWARSLSPNPRATVVLRDLFEQHGPLDLTIISRGTPALAIRSFLAGGQRCQLFAQVALAHEPTIIAPELEAHDGVLTGRVLVPALAKSERAHLIGDDVVFLGDRRDQRWATRSGDRVRFVRV